MLKNYNPCSNHPATALRFIKRIPLLKKEISPTCLLASPSNLMMSNNLGPNCSGMLNLLLVKLTLSGTSQDFSATRLLMLMV